jgi:hypothetical protein
MNGAELEREALGQLILSPALLESCEDLRPDLFEQGENRRAFVGISAIWEDLRPESIDPGVLAHKASLQTAFVASLIDGNFRPDPKAFAWRIESLRKRRAAAELLRLNADEGNRYLSTDEVDPGRLGRIRALWDVVAGAGNGDGPALPAGCLKTGAELQALDVKVEYRVDRLLPARSLTLLYGRSGLGKTWLSLMIAKALQEGRPLFGLSTKACPVVYVDYENPLGVVVDRARRLDIRDVRFWHLSAETPPPKLDGPKWELFKRLPDGSLVVFDTSRASHEMDENDSAAAALVMGRLKELRELGHDILLLHHTTKADDQSSKGSTGWYDLADHTLSFCRAGRGSSEETDEGGAFDPGALLSLGAGKKTRFEPSPKIYLTLDPGGRGLVQAESPDRAAMDALAEHIAGAGSGRNQSEIIGWAKEAGIGPRMRGSFISLLNRGEGTHWRSHKGPRGAKIYEPVG